MVTNLPRKGPAAKRGRIELTVPAGLDVAALVKPNDADSARAMVSTIINKTACRDIDERGFARLYSPYLRKMMGPRYAATIRALLDQGIMHRAPYREGLSSGYRLAEDVLALEPQRYLVVNPDTLERLRKCWSDVDREQARRRKPIHDDLERSMQGLTVLPGIDAKVAEKERPARLCQRLAVDKIRRRQFRLMVGGTGRVFSPFSGLSRDLRPFVRLDVEPLGCVDISASQPSLLAVVLSLARGGDSANSPSNGPKGLTTYKHTLLAPCLPACSSFVSDCEIDSLLSLSKSGCFYNHVAFAASASREFVKKRFLVDVLAKRIWRRDRSGRLVRRDYPSGVEDTFRELFPGVWAFIRDFNAQDNGALIRLLQSAEAWLVLEQVARRLVGRIPFVTLHDAIFARQRDLDTVKAAFDATFEDLGFRIHTKPESWG